MSFFRGVGLLCKKELRDYFASPLIYILAGLFSLISGWLFFNYLVASKELTQQSLAVSVLVPVFGNINFIFLFLAPLITMRLFSEEKKLHTLELLFKSDLSHLQIILGKYLSAIVSLLFLLSLTLIFPVILSLSGYNNWPVVFSSYVGILFSISCYLAVGLFASSLTENQIVAALLGFCILMGMMLLVLTSNASSNPLLAQIFGYFSVPFHFEAFVRGALKSFNLVYFFSFIGFFLYLTHITLDSRNW